MSVACVVGSPSAHAQAKPTAPGSSDTAPAAASDKARAAELFNQSAEAYRQGDFARAIALLDEAYALDPQPVLVYNRARAAESLGDLDAAIAGYEKFLVDEPGANDRGAIEQRLGTLRRQREEHAALERQRLAPHDVAPETAAAPTPPPEETPTTDAGGGTRSPLPYVVAGVGAAGILVGAVLGASALSKNDDAAAERGQQKAIELKDSADGLATASTVSFVLGGILVAAGVSWWFVDRGASKKDRAAELHPRVWVTASGIGGTFR